MCDLCRQIFGLVVDLFRSRAALEAEVLVLKQQIIVLRPGKPDRLSFLTVDKIILGWPVDFFRTPMSHSPLLSRTLLFDGTVQASDCFGAGSPAVVWAVRQCQLRSAS
jgi:hypothetical protein